MSTKYSLNILLFIIFILFVECGEDYYELLGVEKNATKAEIQKAFNKLSLKYHPDDNKDNPKKDKEMFIQIAKAYEILSNQEKRAEYDDTIAKQEALKQERILQEQLKHEIQNQQYTQTKYNENATNVNQTNKIQNSNNSHQQQFQQDYEDAINKAYHDAYIQDMKNRGYKIKYKKTWNERLRSLIALLITIGIILLILQIPFVKEYFNSLYRDNEIIRNIVDGISNWFK